MPANDGFGRRPEALWVGKAHSATRSPTCIPLGQLCARLGELDPARELGVFCRAGVKSLIAVEALGEAGFQKAMNLEGGLHAWTREVDPQVPSIEIA